jgi:hypothetical protein
MVVLHGEGGGDEHGGVKSEWQSVSSIMSQPHTLNSNIQQDDFVLISIPS